MLAIKEFLNAADDQVKRMDNQGKQDKASMFVDRDVWAASA